MTIYWPGPWVTFSWSPTDPSEIWPEPPAVPAPTFPNITDWDGEDIPLPDFEPFFYALLFWSLIALPYAWMTFTLALYWLYDQTHPLQKAINKTIVSVKTLLRNVLHRATHTLYRMTYPFRHSGRVARTIPSFSHAALTQPSQLREAFQDVRAQNGHRGRNEQTRQERCPSWAYTPITESARTYVNRMVDEVIGSHRSQKDIIPQSNKTWEDILCPERAWQGVLQPLEQQANRGCYPRPTYWFVGQCLEKKGHNDGKEKFIQRLLHEQSQNELILALDVCQLTSKVERLEAEKATLTEKMARHESLEPQFRQLTSEVERLTAQKAALTEDVAIQQGISG